MIDGTILQLYKRSDNIFIVAIMREEYVLRKGTTGLQTIFSIFKGNMFKVFVLGDENKKQ